MNELYSTENFDALAAFLVRCWGPIEAERRACVLTDANRQYRGKLIQAIHACHRIAES